MTRRMLMFLLLIILAVSEAHASQPYIDEGFVVVEATGRGLTRTAAKIDARRNAAQQALGFMLEGTTTYSQQTHNGQTDRTLSEQIIRISRGFVADGEEVISESEDDRHVFTITLRLKVNGSELLSGLLHRGPDKSPLDGLSMAASAMAREQWKHDAGEALAEVFGTFPVNDYVRVSAQAIGGFNIRSSELRFKINMKFDRERYFAEAVPQLLAVLDYVCDARMIDVPFMLPMKQAGDVVTLTPPETIDTMRQYMKLMEMEAGNRAIHPEARANVYIQTRDYYFNAYRVDSEAFSRLIEKVFASDARGRLSTKQGYGELNLSIAGEGGRVMDFAPVVLRNVNNIMFFMDRSAVARHPLLKGKPYDDKHNALFILPAFGLENDDGRDFRLYQEDSGELPPIRLSAEELMSLGKSEVQCSIIMK